MNKLKQLIVALAPRIGLMALAIGLVMALCSGTASAAPVSAAPVMQVAQAQVVKTIVVSAPTAAPAIKNVSVASGSSLSKTGAMHGNKLGQVLDLNPEYKANPAFVRAGATIKVYANGSAAPAPAPAAHTASTNSGSTYNGPVSRDMWNKIAFYESTHNWQAVDPPGRHFGGLQFLTSTWKAYGGGEFAPRADKATQDEQMIVAMRVLEGYKGTGPQGWGAWSTARKAGAPAAYPQFK